ncbi:hypothetical protein NQ015_01855 [Corynebacterium sp. 153RC1]|uniref:type IV toxin-antitoxin system AbiEi family antitoxin domain-containing protein n=1 Tax=unclassified Corynebacterium TaxID=2624378 RepID=UPI00211B842E|nr:MULTISPECIES: type IV toxin-antitoxin system AbiEi family antitoxin domain-containing protein [unclassified Corynebacterium]MCQ9352330.1 hypothetical protein [Corynebacterium sp. 209RC1]MCQ9354280.1 hypothetical protein [Corynebacterium sp. 1222RC1]MCQ9356562.1 hypothetical protein [Corynebacterium sp. 122RC1]MCQ9358854.1 hypothetical protein [Corynebacterium sp. 142RC1]MCQ9360514.1 hypothetical protein [Corynebacterium sp. 153RC1]
MGRDFNVVTTAQLLRQGWTESKIRHSLRKQRLFRVFRGVYADVPVTPLVIAFACVLVRPDIVFEGRTAIELYRGQEVTLPLRARVRSGNLRKGIAHVARLRRTRLKAYDLIEGLPVVLPVDAAQGAPELDGTCMRLLDDSYAGKTGPERLAKDLKEMGRAAKAQVKRFCEKEAVIGADSVFERRFVRSLRKAGLNPVPQCMVAGYRWDVGFPKARVVIDLDSEKFHLDPGVKPFIEDRWKTNEAQASGWIALRITDQCLPIHEATFIDAIKRILDHRSRYPRRRLPELSPNPVWRWHVMLQDFAPVHF